MREPADGGSRGEGNWGCGAKVLSDEEGADGELREGVVHHLLHHVVQPHHHLGLYLPQDLSPILVDEAVDGTTCSGET